MPAAGASVSLVPINKNRDSADLQSVPIINHQIFIKNLKEQLRLLILVSL